jgi:hypothetical protein
VIGGAASFGEPLAPWHHPEPISLVGHTEPNPRHVRRKALDVSPSPNDLTPEQSLEYDEAQRANLPSLVYIIDEENQPLLPKYVETGPGAERPSSSEGRIEETATR